MWAETTVITTGYAMSNNDINNIIELQRDFYQHLQSKGRSRNTLKNYKTDLDCFNSYLLNKKVTTPFAKFSIPQIEEYGKYLDVKYTSDNSRRRRVQALRLFFDYLVTRGVFDHNPVRKIPTSPKFLDIPRPSNFTSVKTLWLYLLNEEKDQTNSLEKLKVKRNQLIFTLIYLGGLKVSDLSKLKRDHFSFAKKCRVMIIHPKRDPYSIELPDFFRTIYESYINLLNKVCQASGLDFQDILFNANAHKILSGGLSARGIELIFDGWRKKLVIDMTPKSLRQSCIYTWLQKGLNDATIKEWMGVAPSYSLKPYKDHLMSHPFNDDFIRVSYEDINP
jgi:integrase/recombinase XerC